MTRNWFCKRPMSLPRTISLAALFVVACFAAVKPALADAPTWLQQAAKAPVTPAMSQGDAVILYNEQQTNVQSNGEVETLYRRAYLILRPNGKAYATLAVAFDKESHVTSMEGWCIPKEGKPYNVKMSDATETSYLGEFYTDTRIKILQIPASYPGNVIGYEYRQKGRPFILQGEWVIQNSIPTVRSLYTLNVPAGWEFNTRWIHYAEQAPLVRTQTQVAWEVDNIPGIENEPGMPPLRAVVARMGVTYHPTGPSVKEFGPSTWDQIGTWAANLASGPMQAISPEMQQKVSSLTANATTWQAKVTWLADYVQSQIRYVAIEIGIGGFQPHAAAEVYRQQYGDCKDKATLLSAMLHQAGIDSYLALAQTGRGIVAPEFASAITFNHAILAIKVPQGDPAEKLPSVVTTTRFGKLLFFDPTDTYTPFGYIPSYLQENRVLVSTPEGGELVQLPLLPPVLNRLDRQAKLELHPDGTLTGAVSEVRVGGMASLERSLILAAGSDRAKVLETYLGRFLTGFHLTQATADNLEQVDRPLGLNYQFVAERYAKSAGDLLIVRPRVLGEKVDDYGEGQRQFPVDLREASMQTDTFEITLPPGYAADDVPPPTKLDSSFASYSSEVRVDGDKMTYTRTYQVKEIVVPMDQLTALRRFDRQVSADEKSDVVLHKTAQ
jgi:Domain of Unknown Function with PDB structure (DUF3857)/Transglutaminase-like superfamily